MCQKLQIITEFYKGSKSPQIFTKVPPKYWKILNFKNF